MQQSLASTISLEDQQLIEIQQLGKPLGIYRLKPKAISFWRAIYLFILLIGIVYFVAVLILSQLEKAKFPIDFYIFNFQIFDSVMISISFIVLGVLLVALKIPGDQSQRLIVCEHGLVQIYQIVRYKHIDIVRWDDMWSISKALFIREYSITYKRKKTPSRITFKTLVLSVGYQGVDEIVSIIKRQKASEATMRAIS